MVWASNYRMGRMRHKLKILVPCWSLCLLLTVCGQCLAEAPAAPSSAVRVAVIDTAGLKKFTSILEACCAKDKRIVQVDRTMIHALVKEQRLQTVLSQRNWRQAGKMLNAEVIVLIGKGKRHAFARVIATHLGVVLAEHRFDAAHKLPEAQAQHVYNLLGRDLRKALLKPKDVLLLSAAALTAEVYSPKLVGLERRVTLELLHHLANHKQIVLLERRRLDTVAWEQGLDPSAKLATAKAVLIGSISRKNGKILLDGTLRPAGRNAVHIGVDAPSDKPELLAPRIVAAILKAADLATAKPLSLKSEADFHARQAKTLVYHGLIPEAAAAADSAFALGCRDRELLLNRVIAHSLRACPEWSHFWWLDPGPRRSGSPRRGGPILDLVTEPWRIGAAVRAVDAVHDYFRYIDATKKLPFDHDLRIVGARMCLYGSRVLLSAHALGMSDRDTPGQFAYLRKRLQAAEEFVFKLPPSPETRAIRQVARQYIPLWCDDLDKRMAAYARLLRGPDKATYGTRWKDLIYGELSIMSPGGHSFRSPRSEQFTRVYELGGPHGQIYPWEPNVLARRKKWLERIVGLTRSTTPSERQLGWMLWKLWMDTQSYTYCCQQNWIRREHPKFDWKTEAREAWGMDDKIDLAKWTQQKILAMAWELRERIVTAEEVPFGLQHAFIEPLYRTPVDVRRRWLEYLAAEAPNMPQRLTLEMADMPDTGGQRAALLDACRKRLDTIKPEFRTRKRSYLNNNRTIGAKMLDRVIAGRDPFSNDPPPKRPPVRRTKPSKPTKPSVAKGPAIQTRLLYPYLIRRDRHGRPVGGKPAGETESRTWWKTWRRRCLWRSYDWKKNGKAGMTVLAINPLDGSFWAVDAPDELLVKLAAPRPRSVIAEDAIYIIGSESCARWRPGQPWHAFDLPTRGEVMVIGRKLHVLFAHSSGTGRFGLGGTPTQASGVYEYDPDAKKVTLLIASRRIPGKTVLDNCPPYHPEILFLDAGKRLNVIVRSWDSQTDTIYRRDGQWKWTPVHVRQRTRLMHLEYDRVDGRTFIHGRHTATNHSHHEEWGIMPGTDALVECIWRHPKLDPAKGLAPGTPRDKCPPGPFVWRNGKRYYLGGPRRIGVVIKPELLIYDEKTGRTSSHPLLQSLSKDHLENIAKYLLVGRCSHGSSIDRQQHIKMHLAEVLTARRLHRVESGLILEDAYFGSPNMVWFIPWTAIDEARKKLNTQPKQAIRPGIASTLPGALG